LEIINVKSGDVEGYPYPQAKREDERAQAVQQLFDWARERVEEVAADLTERLIYEYYIGIVLMAVSLNHYRPDAGIHWRSFERGFEGANLTLATYGDEVAKRVVDDLTEFGSDDLERANLARDVALKLLESAMHPMQSDLSAKDSGLPPIFSLDADDITEIREEAGGPRSPRDE
jgi:hypothetical protein